MPADPFEVACPHCSAVYTVARADLGREGTCHDCGAKFTARRWNAACWMILAAIVLGLLVGVSYYRSQDEPRRGGGYFLAVGTPGGGVFVAGGR